MAAGAEGVQEAARRGRWLRKPARAHESGPIRLGWPGQRGTPLAKVMTLRPVLLGLALAVLGACGQQDTGKERRLLVIRAVGGEVKDTGIWSPFPDELLQRCLAQVGSGIVQLGHGLGLLAAKGQAAVGIAQNQRRPAGTLAPGFFEDKGQDAGAG